MFTGQIAGNVTGHIGGMNYGGFMAPIATAGTIANTATTATAHNVANTIVMRDSVGHFAVSRINIDTITTSSLQAKEGEAISFSSNISIGKGHNTNIISAPVGGNIIDVQEFTKQHVNPRSTRYQVNPQFIKYGAPTKIKRSRKWADQMVYQEINYQDNNINSGYMVGWLRTAVLGTCRFITDIDVIVSEDVALDVRIKIPRTGKKPTYLTFKTEVLPKNKINRIPFIGFRTPIPDHYIDNTLFPIIQFYNGDSEYIPEKVTVGYIIPHQIECYSREAVISKIFLHQTVISTPEETLVLRSPLLDKRHKIAMDIIEEQLIPVLKEWLYSPDGPIFKKLQAEFKRAQKGGLDHDADKVTDNSN